MLRVVEEAVNTRPLVQLRALERPVAAAMADKDFLMVVKMRLQPQVMAVAEAVEVPLMELEVQVPGGSSSSVILEQL